MRAQKLWFWILLVADLLLIGLLFLVIYAILIALEAMAAGIEEWPLFTCLGLILVIGYIGFFITQRMDIRETYMFFIQLRVEHVRRDPGGERHTEFLLTEYSLRPTHRSRLGNSSRTNTIMSIRMDSSASCPILGPARYRTPRKTDMTTRAYTHISLVREAEGPWMAAHTRPMRSPSARRDSYYPHTACL